ncbi:hypothetical protein C8R44DRAFT_754207 [Mycena epipterygia]|nr:hypothetical protein C8R44DRAFT_754207 [Mycena epipterygia]
MSDSDDDEYRYTSPALEYEQSQHKQDARDTGRMYSGTERLNNWNNKMSHELENGESPESPMERESEGFLTRDKREAALSPEQLAQEARYRHEKRVRLGHSPASSPVKQEVSSPLQVPRSTAIEARHILGPFILSLTTPGSFTHPVDFFDSQTGNETYIDRLSNQAREGTPSQQQDFFDIGESQDEILDSDHELDVQVKLMKTRLVLVLKDRDEMQEQRDRALEKVAQWEETAGNLVQQLLTMLPN